MHSNLWICNTVFLVALSSLKAPILQSGSVPPNIFTNVGVTGVVQMGGPARTPPNCPFESKLSSFD